jgi:hypothetical protein
LKRGLPGRRITPVITADQVTLVRLVDPPQAARVEVTRVMRSQAATIVRRVREVPQFTVVPAVELPQAARDTVANSTLVGRAEVTPVVGRWGEMTARLAPQAAAEVDRLCTAGL